MLQIKHKRGLELIEIRLNTNPKPVIWFYGPVLFSKGLAGFLTMKKTQNLKLQDSCLLRVLLTLSSFFMFLGQGQARVFSFENESVAPFIQLRSGLSSMGTAPYQWQSAGRYSGDKVDLVYGGEFGVYLRGSGFGMSLGILVHTFDPVQGGAGANSGGTSLYTVDSEGLAYGPQVLFDYQFSREQNYMWKFVLGGGYQFSKISNSYTFTSDGQALVGGQSSLEETYRSDSPFATIGVGTEFVMSGTTTVSVLLGYHYTLNQVWKYSGSGQNFSGSFSEGGTVLFEDGSQKKIDSSYPFLQLGFQFYVDTVR